MKRLEDGPIVVRRGERVTFNGYRATVHDMRVVDGELHLYLIFGDNGHSEGRWCVIDAPPDDSPSLLVSLAWLLGLMIITAIVVYATISVIRMVL